jgi:hypothetical protein
MRSVACHSHQQRHNLLMVTFRPRVLSRATSSNSQHLSGPRHWIFTTEGEARVITQRKVKNTRCHKIHWKVFYILAFNSPEDLFKCKEYFLYDFHFKTGANRGNGLATQTRWSATFYRATRPLRHVTLFSWRQHKLNAITRRDTLVVAVSRLLLVDIITTWQVFRKITSYFSATFVSASFSVEYLSSVFPWGGGGGTSTSEPGCFSRYSDSPRAGLFGDRVPVQATFSTPVQTCPGAHPPAYTAGTGSLSCG